MLKLIKLIRRYGWRDGWEFWHVSREQDAQARRYFNPDN